MGNFVILAFVATLFIASSNAWYGCGVCDESWVLQPDGKQCVSVVKSKCSGLTGIETGRWKRGTHIWSNCNSDLIPTQTAIATFHGPGRTYKTGSFQHAAIFIGCESGGILVHDQWADMPPPGGCLSRVIRSDGDGVNRAGNYYTIEL